MILSVSWDPTFWDFKGLLEIFPPWDSKWNYERGHWDLSKCKWCRIKIEEPENRLNNMVNLASSSYFKISACPVENHCVICQRAVLAMWLILAGQLPLANPSNLGCVVFLHVERPNERSQVRGRDRNQVWVAGPFLSPREPLFFFLLLLAFSS